MPHLNTVQPTICEERRGKQVERRVRKVFVADIPAQNVEEPSLYMPRNKIRDLLAAGKELVFIQYI